MFVVMIQSFRKYSFILISEPLPGVLGNKGTGAFIFREQGIFSNYFQGTRELLNRLLGTREHQSNLKGFFNFVIELALRPCDSCLEKKIQCIKAAVVCVKELVREKKEQSDPLLSVISPIPDGVHVAKRKRQSFSNWFQLVKHYRVNLVQLRKL